MRVVIGSGGALSATPITLPGMSTLRIAPDPAEGLSQRVAEEVRALMARQRITQTRLAEVLDIPQSSVSARLRGTTPFKLPELEQLAALFGVHLAVLFGLPIPGPRRPDGDPVSGDFEGTRRYQGELDQMRDLLANAEPKPPVTLVPAA